MKPINSSALRGTVCALLGGICWGLAGTCGQYLFSNYSVSSLWVAGIRCLVSGIVLTLLALRKHRQELRPLLHTPRDLLILACYGIFGLMMCQYGNMTAISYSNAATATVLQTLNLVFVMLLTCIHLRRTPSRIELLALILALSGAFLLATGGNPTQLRLSPKGLFWGILAASAITCYTLIPRGLLTRWSRELINGLAMLLGGILLNLAGRSWTVRVELPWQGWLALGGIIFFGTIFAYSFYTMGIQLIGPVKASMLAVSEPLSATVFSVFFLNTRFSAVDLIGFALILSTFFLLGNPRQTPAESPEPPAFAAPEAAQTDPSRAAALAGSEGRAEPAGAPPCSDRRSV